MLIIYALKEFDREGREIKRQYFRSLDCSEVDSARKAAEREPDKDGKRTIEAISLPREIKKLNTSFDYTTEDRLKLEVNKLGAKFRSILAILRG